MLSYKPLWHTLVDKGIKKSELCEMAGISTTTMAKLGNNKIVTTETLDKICLALGCRIEEIVEVIK